MRHDTHFVDQLVRPGAEVIGRLIPLSDIDPNPNQPRQSMGDLSELVASIREKGVIEPILVRPRSGRFSDNRRGKALPRGLRGGLVEIPCVLREVGDAEALELALVENLQRRDLTALEEADGMKELAEGFGYTHETLAEMLGKSRSSVTESLSLAGMPEQIRELCRLADIQSKSLLLQVVRQANPGKMASLVERLQKEGPTRRAARAMARAEKPRAKGRPRSFVFRFQPPEKTFNLSLQFRKGQVERDEIIRALRSILDELLRGETPAGG